MKFKMEWDGIIDCEGRKLVKSGIHIICTDSEAEAINRAYKFFHDGGFINWDAIVENGVSNFVISSD